MNLFDEPAQIPGCSKLDHHDFAGAGLCSRHHPGPHLWCWCRYRCLLHRVQTAQPVAAHLRRRRILPGLRADSGRVQDPAGRGGDAHLHCLCQRPSDPGAGPGDRHRHPRCTVGGVGHGPGFCRQHRKIRADHRPVAGDVSLYIPDLAVFPGRSDPQYLEPLFGAGLHAYLAERGDDRLRRVADAVLQPANHGVGLGRAGGWPGAVAVPAASAEEDRHARVAAPEPQGRGSVAGTETDAAA